MGFTTQLFIFVFFPLCCLAYFGAAALEHAGGFGRLLRRLRLRDVILAGFSLCFYAWTCVSGLPRLCAYMLLVYLLGRWIAATAARGRFLLLESGQGAQRVRIACAGLALAGSVALVLFILIYTKYTGMLADTWNVLFGTDVTARTVFTPLGISFLTFSSVSYLVDIARGAAEPGNLLDCVLYLSLFPKVVSGPIVLWRDFQKQIPNRAVSLDGCVYGAGRVMIGFAKKLILADVFGAALQAMPGGGIDCPTAWGAALLYMLQIYYDFSGYSDIAIGLARMFGFSCKENFCFPYRSLSVSEFWRRWHISLGTWFREYVYFPLGGSRCPLRKTLRNLAVVFLLTGLWHGAGWNYLLWGAINGGFVMLERVIRDRAGYRRTPAGVKWLGTMLITMLCWQFFRFPAFSDVLWQIRLMFGLAHATKIPYTWRYFFDARTVTLAVIGVLGATVLGGERVRAFGTRMLKSRVGFAAAAVGLLILFGIALLFMVSAGYAPFIYFRY